MHASSLSKLLTPALLLLIAMATPGCLVGVEDGYDDGYYDEEEVVVVDTPAGGPRTRPERVVVVEEEVVVVEEEVVVVVEDPIVTVPRFVPRMGVVSSQTLEEDTFHDTSWGLYEFGFADEADSYACVEEIVTVSRGSVVSLALAGFEIENEWASCPIGRYEVVADCNLIEGEACMEIVYRDEWGERAGREYAGFGQVDISVVPAAYRSEPNRCVISTRIPGQQDMTFDVELYFDDYDLSPSDFGNQAICSM